MGSDDGSAGTDDAIAGAGEDIRVAIHWPRIGLQRVLRLYWYRLHRLRQGDEWALSTLAKGNARFGEGEDRPWVPPLSSDEASEFVNDPRTICVVAIHMETNHMAGFVYGASRMRSGLERVIAARAARIRLELYTVNHLLAMQVRTGSGAMQAVQRVVERGRGVVVQELVDLDDPGGLVDPRGKLHQCGVVWGRRRFGQRTVHETLEEHPTHMRFR